MSRHGHMHSAKGPSQRQLRVGEEVRHALAWIVERGELRDPTLAKTPITITEVRVSPDLKNATCFVTPLGGGEAEAIKEVLAALDRAKKFLRHEVAGKLNLRFAPNLSFVHDTSFDEAGHIDAILHSPEVARDLADDEDNADNDGEEALDEGDED